jgi:arylsulfatase A-like enzyme
VINLTRRQILSAACALSALPARSAAQPAAPPNVVVFLADDLGGMDTEFQGGPARTPHLDRLCSEGVRFERFYSFPLCSSTRSALLSGRNPVRFGLGYTVVRPWSTCGLPVAKTTMADFFRSAGYQTAAVGKWHLGHANRAHLPRLRGFDHFWGRLNGAIDYFSHERDGGIDWQRNGVSIRERATLRISRRLRRNAGSPHATARNPTSSTCRGTPRMVRYRRPKI